MNWGIDLDCNVSELKGKTLLSITGDRKEQLHFNTIDGETYVMAHEQD